jgi:2'-5' RNA ligase
MAPYVALAQAYGAAVRIWHLDATPQACRARQTHVIPNEVFDDMQRALQHFSPPPWWPARTTIPLSSPGPSLRAYLGLFIEPADELESLRASVCMELDLEPKTEFHVTLAFLGGATPEQCNALAELVAPDVEDGVAVIRFRGTGAAYEPAAGAVTVVRTGEPRAGHEHARVAWWSVAMLPSLSRLRARVVAAMGELGLTQFAVQPFHPHVTLGSRGRTGIADADFDLYDIAKEPSLGDFFTPAAARATRLHVTASKVLPGSLVCIRAW